MIGSYTGGNVTISQKALTHGATARTSAKHTIQPWQLLIMRKKWTFCIAINVPQIIGLDWAGKKMFPTGPGPMAHRTQKQSLRSKVWYLPLVISSTLFWIMTVLKVKEEEVQWNGFVARNVPFCRINIPCWGAWLTAEQHGSLITQLLHRSEISAFKLLHRTPKNAFL